MGQNIIPGVTRCMGYPKHMQYLQQIPFDSFGLQSSFPNLFRVKCSVYMYNIQCRLKEQVFETVHTMKSPVVINSTFVSRFFKISLNTRPISFFEIFDTAQISTIE